MHCQTRFHEKQTPSTIHTDEYGILFSACHICMVYSSIAVHSVGLPVEIIAVADSEGKRPHHLGPRNGAMKRGKIQVIVGKK